MLFRSNTAWGVGLLGGPALGGWLFERVGFAALATSWAIVVIVATAAIAGVNSGVRLKPDATYGT